MIMAPISEFLFPENTVHDLYSVGIPRVYSVPRWTVSYLSVSWEPPNTGRIDIACH